MSEKKKNDVKQTEIENEDELSDEELEAVAGGARIIGGIGGAGATIDPDEGPGGVLIP